MECTNCGALAAKLREAEEHLAIYRNRERAYYEEGAAAERARIVAWLQERKHCAGGAVVRSERDDLDVATAEFFRGQNLALEYAESRIRDGAHLSPAPPGREAVSILNPGDTHRDRRTKVFVPTLGLFCICEYCEKLPEWSALGTELDQLRTERDAALAEVERLGLVVNDWKENAEHFRAEVERLKANEAAKDETFREVYSAYVKTSERLTSLRAAEAEIEQLRAQHVQSNIVRDNDRREPRAQLEAAQATIAALVKLVKAVEARLDDLDPCGDDCSEFHDLSLDALPAARAAIDAALAEGSTHE